MQPPGQFNTRSLSSVSRLDCGNTLPSLPWSVLANRQLFTLTARRTEQKNFQLARIRIKFTHHAKLETAALEAGHREPPERAVGRRLGRLIIFPTHEIAGGIHISN